MGRVRQSICEPTDQRRPAPSPSRHWCGVSAPTTGKLISNLKVGGVAPEDIDVIMLTHCHIDHIGGAVDAESKPAFPNAHYVIWRDEWDF